MRPDNKTLKSSESGFTLIETMIAMTVFATGILAINLMQTSSIAGNSSANIITGQTNWASTQIEKIAGWDYSNANLTDDGNASSFDGSFTSPDTVYTMSWRVSDNTPIQDTKTIIITVTDIASSKVSTFAYIKAEVL